MKMSRRIILLAAASFFFFLAACAEAGGLGLARTVSLLKTSKPDTGAKNAFAIVLQATRNSVDPGLYLRLSNVADTIASWSTSGSACALVSVSGAPQITETLMIPESDAVTPQQVEDDRGYWAAKIIDAASGVTAAAGEVDSLGAITKAANWLLDQKADQKYLLYIGSGIATQSEVFSFLDADLISADPEALAAGLRERGALPDLSGVGVVFGGLGCTELPQTAPGPATRTRLARLYQSIVTAAGGSFEQLYTELGGSAAQSEYAVTPVTFPAEDPITLLEPVVFTQDEIMFHGDCAEYVNPQAVENTLEPYARELSARGLEVLLAGFVAGGGTDGFSYTLSLDRAAAVRDSLVALGVDPALITVAGLGGGGGEKWHTPDTDADGRLIESAARLNRRVVMLSLDSDDARELLELARELALRNGGN